MIFIIAAASAGPVLARIPQRRSSKQPSSWSIQTVQLSSRILNKTLPYNIILPRHYQVSNRNRYPVLYLLHGVGGHYSDWATKTNVADYAATYPIIVVMPEADDSWYTDSGTAGPGKYETYILTELIPDVQKRYRTIETRDGRAVAGLSMGGYGALKFGLKFPGMFIFCGSISGALGAPSWTENDLKEPGAIRNSVLSVFGPAGSETRRQNDIFEILRSFSAGRISALPFLYLDCGTEDPFFTYNAEFAALLREKKAAHEYRELPGNHSWSYWDQQVREVLKVAAERLRKPRW